MVVIRNFPFDPLGGLGIPTSGIGDPQSSYLKTPVIRPIPTSRNQETNVPKGNQTVGEKKDESK
jgi:hypothetical protein